MDQEQTPRERALELVKLLVPDWRPTREQVLWAIRIAVVVIVVLLGVLLLLYVIARVFGIRLFDLLKVVAVPITIGAAVPLLNWLQKKRELDVESQRAQDEALQAYLDQMSQLLLDKDMPLRQSKEGDEARILARARTLQVLGRLDGDRKGSVVQFLYESGLINRDHSTPIDSVPIVNLKKANLRGAILSKTNLELANLYRADLKRANLRGAVLSQASLFRADLKGADLRGADLRDTILYFADLEGANLLAAKVTRGQLEEARSLQGATMPNGQKYEDWLKDKEGQLR